LSNLAWGTAKQNAQDKIEHGNQPFGESSPKSALKRSDVIQIREMYQSGDYTQVDLSDRFGVSRAQIHRILTGKRWARADGPILEESMNGLNLPGAKLTERDIVDIRIEYKNGSTLTDLGERFGISFQHVSRIVNGKRFRKLGGPIKGEDY
jgi:transcriptional regulator with XRE-family HTH domain